LSTTADKKSPCDGFDNGFAVYSPDVYLEQAEDQSQLLNSLLMNRFNHDDDQNQ
jgi:hypothetical protein